MTEADVDVKSLQKLQRSQPKNTVPNYYGENTEYHNYNAKFLQSHFLQEKKDTVNARPADVTACRW